MKNREVFNKYAIFDILMAIDKKLGPDVCVMDLFYMEENPDKMLCLTDPFCKCQDCLQNFLNRENDWYGVRE